MNIIKRKDKIWSSSKNLKSLLNPNTNLTLVQFIVQKTGHKNNLHPLYIVSYINSPSNVIQYW